MEEITDNVFLCRDTCNVYAVCRGDTAVLIDFGDGRILPQLGARGITATDVLMTHHHRDQGQGLPRAAAAGMRIWVPHTEQDLFAAVDAFWQARDITNNYNTRQDRFSLLEQVPVHGTLRDYATYAFGDTVLQVIPTPGHTTGSISLLLDSADGPLIFCGDLIAAPGKVWSLAATQWSYNGAEGVAASIPSLLDLQRRRPHMLLPAHGEPLADPEAAIAQLVPRLYELLTYRRQNPRLFELLERPYEALTPHLLRNRTSMSNAYVLLSQSGKALFLDFGYDFVTGVAAGQDRASRRPWLYTLPALKEQFGVTAIDVALPTHHHDDHVAGLNLLRDVEGTQVWAAANFAPILQHPADYDLPCLWYDPIPVDRVLPLEEPLAWEEYALTLYPLPGHTHYAVAIFLVVDGRRVLLTGDQYQDDDGLLWNYVYQNHFEREDYIASAALYRRLQPELILSGHWAPLWVEPGYFEALEARGAALARLHNELLPEATTDGIGEALAVRLTPYHTMANPGDTITLTLQLRNPLPERAEALLRLALPAAWARPAPEQTVSLPGGGATAVSFTLPLPAGRALRRARVAADITLDGRPLGQLAEALITTLPGARA